VHEAARSIGQQVHILYATSERELDDAFSAMSQIQAGALVVSADPFFNSRRDQIITLAARHAIPAIYEGREYAVAGGLASYGTSLSEAYHQLGVYTARILGGAKPADLPVVQSTKFEFVLNLKTAKALGLKISDNLLSLDNAARWRGCGVADCGAGAAGGIARMATSAISTRGQSINPQK
jgi:putative ABC transport system substrate-binding protein